MATFPRHPDDSDTKHPPALVAADDGPANAEILDAEPLSEPWPDQSHDDQPMTPEADDWHPVEPLAGDSNPFGPTGPARLHSTAVLRRTRQPEVTRRCARHSGRSREAGVIGRCFAGSRSPDGHEAAEPRMAKTKHIVAQDISFGRLAALSAWEVDSGRPGASPRDPARREGATCASSVR